VLLSDDEKLLETEELDDDDRDELTLELLLLEAEELLELEEELDWTDVAWAAVLLSEDERLLETDELDEDDSELDRLELLLLHTDELLELETEELLELDIDEELDADAVI